MDSIIIYRNVSGTETEIETINPESTSAQVKQMMGENAITLNFTLNHYTDFIFGDYCTVFGELYKVNTTPIVTKKGSNNFSYVMKMEAEYFDLTKAQYLFLGDDNSLKETDFDLIGRARDFINLLVQNANRVSPGWKVGDVTSTIYKNLSFSKENCLTVLARLAEAFETEYWVDGKTIHLSKRRSVSTIRFQHGRNKGLYVINRQALSGSKLTTRLYAYGSDKNLPVGYRNYAKRLKMTGGIDYVESNTAQGLVEDVVIFEDIYPHRTGKITAQGATIYTFFDSSINFDINQYKLPGVEAKLTFNTGQLAGYTFKIASFNPSSKEIRILPNTEEKALEIPSTLLRPEVGNEYILFDISMPQAYIIDAEKKLKTEATKLINKLSSPQYSYQVDIDPAFMKNRSLKIGVGVEVEIEDGDLGISQLIGIVSCTRNIKEESKYSVEVSDKVVVGTVGQIQNVQTSNSRDISEIRKAYTTIQDNKVVGDLTISQGTFLMDAMPVMDGDITNYAKLYIHRTSGKIYREA
jgi:hypothetical protein